MEYAMSQGPGMPEVLAADYNFGICLLALLVIDVQIFKNSELGL